GSCIRVLTSESNESDFGLPMVNVGDVDGDRTDDLLVRTIVTRADGRKHARFILFSGTSTKRSFSIEGEKGKERLYYGRPACRLPDLDGDGVAEFAITIDDEVRVYSGSTHAMLFRCEPTLENEDFGHALCAVGDVDGGGIPD